MSTQRYSDGKIALAILMQRTRMDGISLLPKDLDRVAKKQSADCEITALEFEKFLLQYSLQRSLAYHGNISQKNDCDLPQDRIEEIAYTIFMSYESDFDSEFKLVEVYAVTSGIPESEIKALLQKKFS